MQILALISVALLAQAKGGGAPAGGPNVSFEDKVLATIPDDTKVTDVRFSPDGRQVAYKAFKGGKVNVSVNNQKGPDYLGVEGIRWSPTGKLAYSATNGSTWCVVVGGQAGPQLAMAGLPVFSADGSKFGYEGSRGVGGARDVTAWSMFIGHQKSGDYAACGPPSFSADGSIVAYTVRFGKPGNQTRGFYTVHAMVVNGKMGTEVVENFNPVFAPKGNRYAYAQREREDQIWTMVVDGKSQESFSQLGKPVWSPDGTHLAYMAVQGGKWYMVVDGKKNGDYLTVGEPVFSPDSKHLAYPATKPDAASIILDGKPLEPLSGVEAPAFTPDSSALAYGAWKSPNNKWFMTLGDRKFDASYDVIGKPVISPDGKKVAYYGLWQFKSIIAMNDGKSELYDEIGPDGPVWSPDSKNFAVVVKKDGKWWCVVGYRREEAFDEVSTPPHWSSDGKKCAWGGRKDNQLIWRVFKLPDE